ncbi:hypothetical protein H310_06608 [Aphanomyces invadans]|uniref:Phosphatidic acid phosphatase type 2/haloperoxidase domain-containing protein n=1 Tax=Aphanomyces invadans TaxID=157072 RepID=A0A024U3I6_9STRA|nr:hypothetical protein H310_06608 [Aphanomyces invadans]ETW00961.1 hypothetical protein H310_06608 [Aphanomyces invadans]|eukprot:XP_008869959.1 hypothetical protein H310_06608 [Aphanomyces invadans]
MAGLTTFHEKLIAYRVWEFVACLAVTGAIFALTASSVYRRPIPHLVIPLDASTTIFARDPSLDLKKEKEQVPLDVAIAIFYATPLVVHTIVQWLRYVRNDSRDFLLTLFISSAVCQLLTHFAKAMTGRFRPCFYDMCKWDTTVIWDGVTNLCRDPKGEAEGRKSFPSGHASSAFSTLFLLTLYLLGRSKLLSASSLATRRGFVASAAFFVAFAPTMVAMWIAITRSQDNWHHYSDILAGSVIGICSAILGYSVNYGSLFDYKTAGMPLETLEELKQSELPTYNHAFRRHESGTASPSTLP